MSHKQIIKQVCNCYVNLIFKSANAYVDKMLVQFKDFIIQNNSSVSYLIQQDKLITKDQLILDIGIICFN